MNQRLVPTDLMQETVDKMAGVIRMSQSKIADVPGNQDTTQSVSCSPPGPFAERPRYLVYDPMENRQLDPKELKRINPPFDDCLLDRIVRNMKREGWCGRPLLVEEAKRYSLTKYYAWTGSHRIEAAKRANLSAVPCCVITEAEAKAAFSKAGYNWYGYSCWRDAVMGREGGQDSDRLRALEKAGLHQAAQMVRDEMAAEDGHRA